MGVKGDKFTGAAGEAAELLLEKLASIKNVSAKKMFGGIGVFANDKMFGMINSKGQCFLKVDDALKAEYAAKGSVPQGKMPYSSIPEMVFEDLDLLLEWANKSIALSK